LPTFWAYELAYMMTGAHFALGVAYVMREGQHIRIDFIHARFSPRTKAAIDLGV
jgi:TRAP-type mannitol/chloroaromatic compound transport system permease small subunit